MWIYIRLVVEKRQKITYVVIRRCVLSHATENRGVPGSFTCR